MLNPIAVHLKVGSHLGKYRILRELGEGPMAHVYVADDTLLYRQVALKVLKPELARQLPAKEPIEEEVSSAAVLLHSGIVPLYGSGYDGGYHYFTMALMPGGNLRDAIGVGLGGRQALTIVGQIARALSFAHAKGLNHQGIKPENILFRKDGSAVLADFQAMKIHGFGVGVLTGEVHANSGYASPEDIQNSGRQFGRADLYSLGIVFYEMLTGQLPFQSTDVSWQHVHTPVPRLPGQFAAYQGVIDKLLAKRPIERFDANQLIQAINRLLASESAVINPPSKVTFLPVGEKGKTPPKIKVAAMTAEEGTPLPVVAVTVPAAVAAPLKPVPTPLPTSLTLAPSPDAEELSDMAVDRAPLEPLVEPEPLDPFDPAPLTLPPQRSTGLGLGRYAPLAVLLLLAGGGLYLLLRSDPAPATSVIPPAADQRPIVQEADGVNPALSPGVVDPQARHDFAQAVELSRRGQVEMAENLLQKLRLQYPWLPEPYNNLAALQAAAGRLDEAQELLEAGLRAHPSYAVLVENLNTIHLERTLAEDLPAEKAGTPQLQILSELPSPSSALASRPTASTEREKTPPPSTPTVGEAGAAEKLLNRWAQAWSAQDVENYLTFYGEQFRPAGAAPRPGWEEGRRQALTSPAWIMVALNEIHVSPQGDDRLRVVAMQDYRSDRYRDRTLKGFVLGKQGSEWVILEEESLGNFR